jgi:hypothetical protein
LTTTYIRSFSRLDSGSRTTLIALSNPGLSENLRGLHDSWGIIEGKFRFLKKGASTDAPRNAVVFKRKLRDALIRSLTEPGKHADGQVPGLYLKVRASSKVGKSPSKC